MFYYFLIIVFTNLFRAFGLGADARLVSVVPLIIGVGAVKTGTSMKTELDTLHHCRHGFSN